MSFCDVTIVFSFYNFNEILKRCWGLTLEIGLSCRWAQPLQKNGHVVQKQCGGTLKGNDISFLNDVISVFFLPHYIVYVPATWFCPVWSYSAKSPEYHNYNTAKIFGELQDHLPLIISLHNLQYCSVYHCPISDIKSK